MEKLKPKEYIEIKFEKVDGFYYPQPIEYCNGIKYNNATKELKNRWGDLYWESKWYNECINISRYNDNIWKNQTVKDRAFDIVFKNKSNKDGVYVVLKDFEIYLMNKGYNMISFDKMCAQTPCFSILCERVDGNNIINPKGFSYSRFYTHPDSNISIFFGFGIKTEQLKFNFYFVHSNKSSLHYQVPIKHEDFEKAENLELPSFEEISEKNYYEISANSYTL